jgi:uncharacterized protein (DUF924 family)
MRSLEAFEETRGLTEWAEKHRDIIRRFGRFPTATPSSADVDRRGTEFLKRPGSSF